MRDVWNRLLWEWSRLAFGEKLNVATGLFVGLVGLFIAAVGLVLAKRQTDIAVSQHALAEQLRTRRAMLELSFEESDSVAGAYDIVVKNKGDRLPGYAVWELSYPEPYHAQFDMRFHRAEPPRLRDMAGLRRYYAAGAITPNIPIFKDVPYRLGTITFKDPKNPPKEIPFNWSITTEDGTFPEVDAGAKQ